ncbi:MAG TPA: hypothetical protein VGI75_09985 [Pirellulales bacterium]
MRPTNYRSLMLATVFSAAFVGASSVFAEEADPTSNGSFFCAPALPDIVQANSSSAKSSLDLNQLAIEAVSDSSDDSLTAVNQLRDAGPAGLDALFAAYQNDINRYRKAKTARSVDPHWQRISEALDAVGGQYDCSSSHLYWYTDLDTAKTAAEKTGKPILSLRLLGKLTDQFSCANSRYFRSTLYTNQAISEALRTRYILHWQTVRPVPQVTIDFGDGRKLERTLTGNSIHYVLDSQGRVVDALPGLYGPQAFLEGLQTASTTIDQMKSLTNEAREVFLRKYHADQSKLIQTSWQKDLAELGVVASDGVQSNKEVRAKMQTPNAATAGRMAITKYSAERPLLVPVNDQETLAAKTDDAMWTRIAQLHRSDARLDEASMAYIESQNPTAGRAMPLAQSKAVAETPILRLVRTLQNTIAIDSVRNEYTFHRQIHDWFANGKVTPEVDVNDLNEMVYAELFLTPSSDPWLGLLPRDAYTALENNGLSKN